MMNSKPNNKNYHSGVYVPNNTDKVVKLNDQGGLIYRSSWEKKIMTWLDLNENIVKWGAECLTIPYQLTHYDNGDTHVKSHRYYPDFYYEIKGSDGSIRKVVAEVKPMKEYKMVIELNEGRLTVPEKGIKKLKSFEYDLRNAHRNTEKWKTMIKWCNIKGYEFIIITEDHLKMFNV